MKHLYGKTLPLATGMGWALAEGVTLQDGGTRVLVTAEQVEELMNKAYLEGMEAAARVCDRRFMGDNNREDMEVKRCAEAIRKFAAPVPAVVTT